MSNYIRYEDIPVVIGSFSGDSEFVFANSASLTVNQSLESKRFLDDHVLPFASTGNISLQAGEIRELLLGAPGGPAVPLSSSIEKIESGTLVVFPTGNKLWVESGAYPGDYYIAVRAETATELSFETDLQNGEIQVSRNYCTTAPIEGSLDISFYLNTGTLPSFFNLTGVVAPEGAAPFGDDQYPRVSEEKITGFFGNYFFDNGYLEALSFTTRAFYPYMANASIRLFGTLRYDENNITNFYADPDFNKQKTLPHGVGTTLSGLDDVGMDSSLAFNYSISCDRKYGFLLGEETPTRGAKGATTISAGIEGNNLNPYLELSGTRARITINVKDIGFQNFPDESFGLLKKFEVYGPIVDQNLTVGDGDFLKGSVTVKEVYR